MPADATQASTLGNRLGFGASPVEVDEDWLNLFPARRAPRGGVVRRAPRPGEPVPYGDTGDRPLAVPHRRPAALRAPAPTTSSATRSPQRLERLRGGWSTTSSASRRTELADDLVGVSSATPSTPPSGPATSRQPSPAGALCGVLHPAPGADARVSLATNPTGAADPAGRRDVRVATTSTSSRAPGPTSCPAPTRPPTPARPTSSTPRARSTSWSARRCPTYIGYGDVDPPLVPSTWLEFFEPGVPLSTNNARRVPEDAPPADAAADAG